MTERNLEHPVPAADDPELEAMMKNMAEGKSPGGAMFSGRQLKRMISDAEKKQYREMKRSGIEDPAKLPGEIEAD